MTASSRPSTFSPSGVWGGSPTNPQRFMGGRAIGALVQQIRFPFTYTIDHEKTLVPLEMSVYIKVGLHRRHQLGLERAPHRNHAQRAGPRRKDPLTPTLRSRIARRARHIPCRCSRMLASYQPTRNGPSRYLLLALGFVGVRPGAAIPFDSRRTRRLGIRLSSNTRYIGHITADSGLAISAAVFED